MEDARRAADLRASAKDRAELAMLVALARNDLGRGAPLRGVVVDWDSAPVVGNGDAVVLVDDDVALFAEARDGFIDGVVDHFVDEVVESVGTRGPDVHRRTFPYRVEAFEDLDRTGVIAHAGSVSERTASAVADGRSRTVPDSACFASILEVDAPGQRSLYTATHRVVER